MIRYIVIMLALLCNGCSMYLSSGPARLDIDLKYEYPAIIKGEIEAKWDAWPFKGE